ncbi:aquaporin SIP1-1-like isoform X1 [Magnolia sinica]|uniref:aquaporin SIP1-1-like isoform X1 n=2 Tax=Magnolia sinica TaxID=86752 RepID=UPI00265AA8B8|nr:aquaporin SIP1-1-like isoform X1 [Magnolia sinica]
MGVVKLAIFDGLITFTWMFCVSGLGVLASIIASALNLDHHLVGPLPNLVIDTVLISLIVFFFTLLGQLLGGASFNPTATASFYAAGVGGVHDDLVSVGLRLPAQAAGAVGGAMAIMEFMPPQYKHMLVGPSLKVDQHTGAIAEGVLTFLISFAALLIIQKGPKNVLLQTCLLSVSTMSMIVAGSGYTGPSMNPVNAFGWAYLNKSHNKWEQYYVYWICPFIGAILAAWVFRFIFPPPVKQKKA